MRTPTSKCCATCIRKGTVTGAFTPVIAGSSFKNKGVPQMLDAVVWYLPSPTDVEAIKTVDENGDVVGERITAPTTSRSPRWPSRSSTTSSAR